MHRQELFHVCGGVHIFCAFASQLHTKCVRYATRGFLVPGRAANLAAKHRKSRLYEVQRTNALICVGRSSRAMPTLEIDLNDYAEVGIWCSLPAALSHPRDAESRPPRVHVHLRRELNGQKEVDGDFDEVTIARGRGGTTKRTVVAPHPAFNFIRQIEQGISVEAVSAPQLAALRQRFPRAAEAVIPDRRLDLDDLDPSSKYDIWASTPAIVWTAERPPEQGIHVHVRDCWNRKLFDDTYSVVILDGTELDRKELFERMVAHTTG